MCGHYCECDLTGQTRHSLVLVRQRCVCDENSDKIVSRSGLESCDKCHLAEIFAT